jgi:peptidoglycan/xylan/chitin deacetylase (PgdA/CDA1 family)
MNKKISVLMFHALKSENEDLKYADPHYAMSSDLFSGLITILSSNQIKIDSLRNVSQKIDPDKNYTIFTFDDGHISNYEIAYPKLYTANCSADFFINSAFVGEKGYMSWSQISEMNNNGMSIQSHGHHHYYFDDLNTRDIKAELEISKKTIEDKIGSEVSIFAPPGGRITSEVTKIAHDIGYKMISTSVPGIWKYNTNLSNIPRLPVLKSTTKQLAEEWANQNKNEINKLVAKYYVTRIGKKLLGNTIYDRLRSKVLDG